MKQEEARELAQRFGVRMCDENGMTHGEELYCLGLDDIISMKEALAKQEQGEPVAMRMPKVGDRVVCIEDESLGTVQSLTAGGSPDIKFDDGSHGTYLLREFSELFRYSDSTPQQRTWVGLDWSDLPDEWVGNLFFKQGARWAEAKLKEKTNG